LLPGHTAEALQRTALRYRASGRFAYGYVAGKLRYDPVCAALLSLGAEKSLGAVLDIGCGRGQFGIVLLEAGAAREVSGVDWNRAHLWQARKAAGGLPFHAEACDLSQYRRFPLSDTVLLIDVCYQLDTGAQMELLRAVARAARSLILIRTADPSLGLRSALTRSMELVGRGFWPHAGTIVNARPVAEITKTLSESGFATTNLPCRKGTPFANVLLIARRVGSCCA
jgi:SAM-dependent methyltransferase